eukprot:356396-Chlamydomonas_euryale.AAC.12
MPASRSAPARARARGRVQTPTLPTSFLAGMFNMPVVRKRAQPMRCRGRDGGGGGDNRSPHATGFRSRRLEYACNCACDLRWDCGGDRCTPAGARPDALAHAAPRAPRGNGNLRARRCDEEALLCDLLEESKSDHRTSGCAGQRSADTPFSAPAPFVPSSLHADRANAATAATYQHEVIVRDAGAHARRSPLGLLGCPSSHNRLDAPNLCLHLIAHEALQPLASPRGARSFVAHFADGVLCVGITARLRRILLRLLRRRLGLLISVGSRVCAGGLAGAMLRRGVCPETAKHEAALETMLLTRTARGMRRRGVRRRRRGAGRDGRRNAAPQRLSSKPTPRSAER